MRLLVPAAAAAALLVLAGCSEPEPGSPLPSGAPMETTTSASPAPSATTTPADDANAPDPGPAPTLPPEATTDDAAGAEAFVRYWYDALNHALASGDAGALEAASDPECGLCASYLREVSDRNQRGERLVDGAFDLPLTVASAPDGTGATLVAVTYARADGQVVTQSGTEIEQVESESGSVDAVVYREEGQWRLFGFGDPSQ